MKQEMTGKERILAALRRQPVDRIPWAPLLVPYTIAGFPKHAPHRVAEAMRAVGCDIWTQALIDRVGIWMPKPKSGVEAIKYFAEGDLVTGYKTPEGTITQREASGCFGSMTIPVDYMITTPQDLRIYRSVLENSFLYTADISDHYDWEASCVGQDGVITDVGIGLTPFQTFVEFLAGVENTYYLLADEPVLFNEVMDLMHQQRLLQIKETAKRSKAEVFVNSENTSWTTMSPAIYKKYCASQLDDYADILHAYGKLHVVHMCGKLSCLSPLIAPGRFDAVVDIAPPPAGDTELWEAALWSPDLAVKGGIGCDVFLSSDPRVCYDKACEIIEKTRGQLGVLLGSGDSIPHGTSMENLRAISKAVEEVGAC